MKINSANLEGLRVGFKTNFQRGLSVTTSDYKRIATVIPSDSGEEKYGWLGKIPNVREWIGDRLIQNLMEHDYAIKNKDWELTIGVDRNDIKDDKLKTYGPLFEEMGQSTGSHADRLSFAILKLGWANKCYDGQYYFDTNHPVLDEAGNVSMVANTNGGAGAPWFLMCSKRVLKPVIFQEREPWEFVSKDDIRDENVFTKKQFVYGADARHNVGFGFWQFCYGSKQPLTAANYDTARTAIMSMKGDYGRPLGLTPDLLVVSPTLGGAARKLINSENAANGETNEWRGTAEIFETAWLA
ncbi:Mu-like prophage major head subunit gpT family protein [Pararhizobium sp.]|uniref:Mu-like prophage major head subunit gpT family protein n=1 Tax=Pararhizobium sp. TaxID=1977563 RepID=UPI003D0EDAA6